MSPRSEEFMVEARERLTTARIALDAGGLSSSVGLAYYAMLYAARAALSEEDLHARSHAGVWQLFRETFAATGRFDADLVSAAQRARHLREAADYEARSPDRERAQVTLEQAERFVHAIDGMLN